MSKALNQKIFGSCDSIARLRAVSTSVWLFSSATSFCCDVSVTVYSRFFLFPLKGFKLLFVYSVPFWDSNIVAVTFSARHCLIFSLARFLCRLNFTQACELYPSMNVTKHLKPSTLDGVIGPTTSVTTRPRSSEGIFSHSLGTGVSVAFANQQVPHFHQKLLSQ